MPTVLKVRRSLLLAAACASLIILFAACATPPSATPVPTLGVPTAAFTEMASGGVPNQITAVEFAALELGEATYSGYLCVTTDRGCACEIPTVLKASFSLTPDSRLSYRFSVPDGTDGEWIFDHGGVNYWTFATTTTDANGQPETLFLVSLIFKAVGYELTQVATRVTGEVVECKTVFFHRLDSQTPAP